MASHNRMWTALPAGTEDQWLDSERTYWQVLHIFHLDGANDSLALVLDSILRHPARTLVRKRGGRRRTQQSIRARLKTIAAAARDPELPHPSPLPLRPAPPPRA